MSEQIQAGYGWRLLETGEQILPGDELWMWGAKHWEKCIHGGDEKISGEQRGRRRVAPGEGWEIVPEDEVRKNARSSNWSLGWQAFFVSGWGQVDSITGPIYTYRRRKKVEPLVNDESFEALKKENSANQEIIKELSRLNADLKLELSDLQAAHDVLVCRREFEQQDDVQDEILFAIMWKRKDGQ